MRPIIRATVFLVVVYFLTMPAWCGESLVWTGNAGDKLWSSPGNWDPEQVPAFGDAVTVADYASTIMVTQSTAQLASLVLSGTTLSLTNWTTQLSADIVSIGSGGLVTCAGPYNDTSDGAGGYANASRVWIVCSNLTIAVGGSVDVSGRGFAAYNASSWYGKGYGPSAGSGRICGAGHGGCAVQKLMNNSATGPYGSIDAPVTPGSAGGSPMSDIGGAGGGVVRIEASGTVTVHGSVLANGVGGVNYTGRSAGAGGSIYITCNRFIGTGGNVKAVGGAGGYYNGNTLNAGGGRISIVYSTEAEGADDVGGMVFDVQCGALSSNFNLNNMADCGTLYFPDSKLFLAQDGAGFGGQLYIPGFDSWTTSGDYAVARHLRFVNEGFILHVQGDLVVTGATARLDIGGYDVEPAFWVASPSIKWFQKYHSGDAPWSVTVDGDMRIENGAKFEAFPAVAAMTNEATGYGAFVAVGGQLKTGAGSFVVVRADATNGASVAISASSVDVQTGGTVSAEDFGFQFQYGPGRGWGSGCGGGHGGYGGGCYTNNGVVFGGTYGDSLHPWQPGSGGGYTWNDVMRRGGGGNIRIASSGTVNVDGTMSASALGNGVDDWVTASGGSGGSIFIECMRLTGSGSLLANGGSVTNSMRAVGYVAAGGGGRIAVWYGLPYNPETMSQANLTVLETNPPTFFGSTSVGGGLYSTSASGVDARYCGTGGTVEFVKVSYPVTVVVIR